MPTYWMPKLLNAPDDTLDNYLKIGCRHIIVAAEGPHWDLGELKELLQWRDTLEPVRDPQS